MACARPAQPIPSAISARPKAIAVPVSCPVKGRFPVPLSPGVAGGTVEPGMVLWMTAGAGQSATVVVVPPLVVISGHGTHGPELVTIVPPGPAVPVVPGGQRGMQGAVEPVLPDATVVDVPEPVVPGGHSGRQLFGPVPPAIVPPG
jgi:hypothetical protein